MEGMDLRRLFLAPRQQLLQDDQRLLGPVQAIDQSRIAERDFVILRMMLPIMPRRLRHHFPMAGQGLRIGHERQKQVPGGLPDGTVILPAGGRFACQQGIEYRLEKAEIEQHLIGRMA